ncbi:hypothetical protein DBR42_07935 [Pelomonas sp. HMWF004]|nr:hypothetical protein DBR42_07935 [Pelomonas sp. HMWF004]
MPSCVVSTVVTTQDGGSAPVLTPQQGQGGQCPGGLLLTPAEFDQLTAAQLVEAGSSLPPTSDLATVWGAGFSLVVGCYLIGWAVGAVVNFVKGN